MIIFCPKCQLRGEIVDAPEAAFCLRVTCARCSSAFIVTAINDEALIVLDKTPSGKLPAASAAISSAMTPTTTAAAATNMAASPTAKSDAGDDAPPRASSLRERIALADAPASSTPQRLTTGAATSFPTTPTLFPPAVARAVADSDNPKLATPPAPVPRVIAQTVDDYDTGSRLLRVSPLWWLAAGVAVAAFVVLCNWLISSGTNSRDAAVNLSRTMPRRSSAGNSTANQKLTAPVEEEMTSDDDELPAAPLPALMPPQGTNDVNSGGNGAGFTVQLGSFNKIEEAQELISNLAAAGIASRLDARPAAKKKVWYRVHSGLFASHDEAAAYGRQLRAQKAATDFVVTPTN